MSRTKGSKNKKTIEKEFAQRDPIEQELELNAVEEELIEPVEEEDAEEEDEPVQKAAVPPGMTRADLVSDNVVLQAIREQTEALTRAMPPVRVPFAKFKTRSVFNPTGAKRKLKFVVYQNGYRCNPKTLSDAEFALINSGKIRPGRFISKLVGVRIDRAASPEDQDKIFISYNNKTPDQRMMVRDHWNGFADLLQKVIAEGEARQVRMRARQHAGA